MRRRFFALALVAGLAVACGGSATPTSPSTSNTTNSPQSQLREITILAPPASVHIGKTEMLRAVAQYADGNFVDVTKESVWRSSDAACKVTSDAVVTGMSAGVAEITAAIGDVKSAPARVACGFVITVTTHENFPTEHVTVPGTEGTVFDGPLAGHTFVTDSAGRAVLPPVAAPDFSIHFKKPGFENFTHRVKELPREIATGIPLVPEFGQSREFAGGCPAVGEALPEQRFTMPRAGKIRVRLEFVQSGAGEIPRARISGSVRPVAGGGSLEISVEEKFFAWEPLSVSTAEFRGTPGDYLIRLFSTSCVPSDRWRAFLEYSR